MRPSKLGLAEGPVRQTTTVISLALFLQGRKSKDTTAEVLIVLDQMDIFQVLREPKTKTCLGT